MQTGVRWYLIKFFFRKILLVIMSVCLISVEVCPYECSARGSQKTLNPVPVRVSVAVTKDHDQKPRCSGEGLFNLHFSIAVQFITVGSQDRNSNKSGSRRWERIWRSWRGAAY